MNETIIFDGEEVGPDVLRFVRHPVEIEFTPQGCIVTTLIEHNDYGRAGTVQSPANPPVMDAAHQ